MKNYTFIKKTFALLLVFVLCFSLSACGNKTENSNTTDKTEQGKVEEPQNDIKGNTSKEDFVIGEELKCIVEMPCNLPVNEEKDIATINMLKIEKIKKCDIKNIDDFLYSSGEHTFYQYHYKITLSGAIDKKFAGKIFTLNISTDGSLKILSYFKGSDNQISGSYDSNTDTFTFYNCGFKINEDGTFSGDFIGYSNDILNTYIPISIKRAH